MSCVHVAPLGLLTTIGSTVQHITLDGTNRITLSSGGSRYTVDFDYRLIGLLWP